MQKYDVGTIRQTLDRLHSEGISVTESSLRTWVRTGVIPAAYCGQKAYLYYPNVMKVQMEGTPLPELPPEVTDGIRRIM